MLQSVEGKALIGREIPELQEALGPKEPAFRARQLYDALYRQQVADLTEISSLPQALRSQLVNGFSTGLPRLEKRYDSTDGTKRYLLRLADNRTVEAVLMPEDSRDTICISSQVGC